MWHAGGSVDVLLSILYVKNHKSARDSRMGWRWKWRFQVIISITCPLITPSPRDLGHFVSAPSLPLFTGLAVKLPHVLEGPMSVAFLWNFLIFSSKKIFFPALELLCVLLYRRVFLNKPMQTGAKQVLANTLHSWLPPQSDRSNYNCLRKRLSHQILPTVCAGSSRDGAFPGFLSSGVAVLEWQILL